MIVVVGLFLAGTACDGNVDIEADGRSCAIFLPLLFGLIVFYVLVCVGYEAGCKRFFFCIQRDEMSETMVMTSRGGVYWG